MVVVAPVSYPERVVAVGNGTYNRLKGGEEP